MKRKLTIYLVNYATIPRMSYFRLPFGRDFGHPERIHSR